MSSSEIIFIAVMFLPMVIMGVFGMWPLFFVFLIFNLIFGLTEFIYVKKTGKSVSQHFWKFSQEHKIKAILILVSMALMWTALIWHLAIKL